MKKKKLSAMVLGALALIVLYILCRSELGAVCLGVALILYFLLRMLFHPCKTVWIRFAVNFMAIFLISTFPKIACSAQISRIWIAAVYFLLAVVLAYGSLYMFSPWEEKK